ncbi:hypothetical protein CLOM_g3342 [Closterium sp. NIES-68]|nr:hypothetical protein CLOM_g3342 [Closterium sp. NIES-68]GJP66736.1 hypothetical protein CLOP_g23645 [Closterium sp. NIES-67]GJP81637.1 hypothetical protein CLOP_g11792 [Closterium sp. NIES-67]
MRPRYPLTALRRVLSPLSPLSPSTAATRAPPLIAPYPALPSSAARASPLAQSSARSLAATGADLGTGTAAASGAACIEESRESRSRGQRGEGRIRGKRTRGEIEGYRGERGRGWSTRGWTVAIEGNIGVGKSTALRALSERLNGDVALRRDITGGADVALLAEPLREWRNVRGSGANALEAFYKEPKRFAYTFQSLVFISRASQYKQGVHSHPSALRLCERSVFCDRLVFAPASVAAGLFTPLEEALYDSWFDALLPMMPAAIPDAFIYLRADPAVCLQRLQQRSRSEETSVDLPYLQRLHELYDHWFLEGSRRTDLDLVAAPSFTASLDGALTHRAVDGVSLLVVDCNQHKEQCSVLEDSESSVGDAGQSWEKRENLVMGMEALQVQRPQASSSRVEGSAVECGLLDEFLPFLQRFCAQTRDK